MSIQKIENDSFPLLYYLDASAGCRKGSCWKYCGLSLYSGEWCYTTKGENLDRNCVPCTSDNECDKCPKFAGPCALI